jgi:hypothetical protein
MGRVYGGYHMSSYVGGVQESAWCYGATRVTAHGQWGWHDVISTTLWVMHHPSGQSPYESSTWSPGATRGGYHMTEHEQWGWHRITVPWRHQHHPSFPMTHLTLGGHSPYEYHRSHPSLIIESFCYDIVYAPLFRRWLTQNVITHPRNYRNRIFIRVIITHWKEHRGYSGVGYLVCVKRVRSKID